MECNCSEFNKEIRRNKMKKKIYIIILNILLLLLLFIANEIFAYKSIFSSGFILFPDYKKFEKLKDEFLIGNHLYVNYEKPAKDNPIYYKNDGREENGNDYKKNAILLLGDSYTYGLGLTKEEAFSAQLSKYTKRPVYNWAFCTEGIEYAVLELKNNQNIEKLKNQTKNNPLKYVILTYTYPQFDRTYSINRQYRYFYLRKYGLLEGQKFSYFDYLYTVLSVKNKLYVNSLYKNGLQKSVIKLIKKYIKEINNDIHKNFPDAKLIFLIYSDSIDVIEQAGLNSSENAINSLNTGHWKDMEKEGITVLSTEELIGKKTEISDILQNERTVTIHPNAQIWKLIIPSLSKRLSL